MDEQIVSLAAVGFGIAFTAFIFIKCHSDDKKQKAVMTEIFRRYGVKADARVISFKENHCYGKHGILGKYNYEIELTYNSTKGEEITCTYTLATNDPKSKGYTDTIPVIYIPAYMDYYMELISSKELFEAIGHEVTLGNDCRFVIIHNCWQGREVAALKQGNAEAN